ncbi:MAG TPA: AAA family ATPase, partial [Candidatus Limnocylindrales bacterium]|nr:AAA family ATPase [Candidatus Limnocylindrales bacterium]
MTAPARLLSVRLQGFKSFAERTHVAFGPGISAVVGPNGSGKSNLADALRWALGEQGRALRTRKAEDVIWAGSERRPALGMADVQIVLDNGDALLPVEFGVVELGRRLFRSGENEYVLNRQRVRLKDLVDLLDAAHLAENAFLFIGQGMVDQALALRPEERRPLFEEVAGVRRHERRRRRAEEQLAESEANLTRVEDVVVELRPQVRRLAAQAEQQANRRDAGDELAEGLLLAAHARWHAAAVRLAAADGALGQRRDAIDRAMRSLGEREDAAAGVAERLAQRAVRAAEARAAVDAARDTLTTARLAAAAAEQEAAGLVRELERLAAD